MDKLKQYKYILIPGVIVLSFVFYWTEVRSVLIKKECSMYTEVIPADSGVTREQANLNKNKYDAVCPKNPPINVECFLLKTDSIERLPQPEKVVTKEAPKNKYDACLRRNGL